MADDPVFIVELHAASFTTYEYLCRFDALEIRKETNRGQPRWLSVKQILKDGKPQRVPFPCARCEKRRQDEANTAAP